MTEEQADDVMSDIHYMTQQGWTDTLQHMYDLHKLRDTRLARNLLFHNLDGDIEVSKQIVEMNNGY